MVEMSTRRSKLNVYCIDNMQSIKVVILDYNQAQMVESTVAATAEMARLIPRYYSWAVTGTPMSTGYNDLYGLFLFLGIIPSCSTPASFTSLYQNPDLFYQFLDLTARVIRRNAKKKVQDQVIIPIQRRKLVHISFSQFEQHYYDDLWSQCCRSTDLEWLEANNWGEGDNLTTGQKSRINQMMTELRNWVSW
jgi:E3 ubiquitin-protein ligase SHPRH